MVVIQLFAIYIQFLNQKLFLLSTMDSLWRLIGSEESKTPTNESSSAGPEIVSAGPETASDGTLSVGPLDAGPEVASDGLLTVSAGPEIDSDGLQTVSAGPETVSAGPETAAVGNKLESTPPKEVVLAHQIFDVDEDYRLVATPQLSEFIATLKRFGKVGLVCTTGKYNQGKSFFLNACLASIHKLSVSHFEPFPVDPSVVQTGIWACYTPWVLPNGCNVFFLDTQGWGNDAFPKFLEEEIEKFCRQFSSLEICFRTTSMPSVSLSEVEKDVNQGKMVVVRNPFYHSGKYDTAFPYKLKELEKTKRVVLLPFSVRNSQLSQGFLTAIGNAVNKMKQEFQDGDVWHGPTLGQQLLDYTSPQK